jgi:hypothetical protein
MPPINKEIYDNLRRTSPAVRKECQPKDVSLLALGNAKNTVKGEEET